MLALSAQRVHKVRVAPSNALSGMSHGLKPLPSAVPQTVALLMKMGAAKQAAGRAVGLITVTVPNVDETVSRDTSHFALDREKLRTVRRREGPYLLRTNRDGYDPATLIQRTEVEQAFKALKNDLAIRPVYHKLEHCTEVHIFVAFLSCCLQVTLKPQLRQRAPGLTLRAAIETFKTMRMVDVHISFCEERCGDSRRKDRSGSVSLSGDRNPCGSWRS